MKKILITGVGGNVGRYIGDDLADAGYEVVGVYRNKIPMGSNYILIQADLSKHFSGGGGITDVDTVIHVAAALSGSTRTLIRDNIEATKNLVCWAEQTHVKRLIYLSTVSVYGRVKGEVCETSMMNTPQHICNNKASGGINCEGSGDSGEIDCSITQNDWSICEFGTHRRFRFFIHDKKDSNRGKCKLFYS